MSKQYVIVIGRKYGSGGRVIGELLSQKLGIPLYDKTILGKVAEEQNISDERLRKMDEYLNAHRFTNIGLQAKKALFNPGNWFETNPEGIIDREKVFQWQSDVIRRLADQGPCIIVGRCADEVLRDHPNLISLFITAPLKVREARIAELYPDIPETKYQTYRQYVNQTDRLRAHYYNYHTGRDWGDIANYELVLDSSKLGIPESAAFLAEYIKKRIE
ncbi:MAG: cytidylate kinase-like family protein [Oscillospiraceae bacterium]|nr:cytidylate kinase-like family protein [Oscillospiraceae bacterium]